MSRARGVPEERRALRRTGAVLGAILALAILVRGIYFAQLAASPCIREHRWVTTDMSYFDRWAVQISAGDWLSREIRPPMHPWHRAIATEFFRRHPDAAGTVTDPNEAVTGLWDRWCGGGRFYQEPLYAYLVALTYAMTGPDVRWVFFWQMALGVASVALIWAITRRAFGADAAAAAAALAALCGPLVFYDLVLLRETAVIFMGLLVVWLAGRALERASAASWLAVGLAAGAAALLKTHLLVLLPIALGMLAYARRRKLREALPSACFACLGAAIALLPLAARNVAVGAPLLSTSSASGLNFVIANSAGATIETDFMSIRDVPEIFETSEGRFLPSALGALRTHARPFAYAGYLVSKLGEALHWYEVPNNENFYYYRLHAPVLRWLPVGFLVVAPLAIVGLGFAFRHPGPAALVLALAAIHLAALALFLPYGRIRIPLVAAMLPFAGLALERVVAAIRGRRFGALLGPSLVAVAVVAWAARPIPGERPLIRPTDYAAAYWVDYDERIEQAQVAGDHNRAAAILEESLRVEPRWVHARGPGHPPRTDAETAILKLFAGVRERRADALRRAGRVGEADVESLTARRMRIALTATETHGAEPF
jgi:4-amino-4-deoxy-L-arabinose transferase-like glycosyltransferase